MFETAPPSPPTLDAARISALWETLRRAPDREDGWLQVGNTLFQAGEQKEAIKLLQEGAKKLPGSAPIRYNLGYMLEQLSQWELAAACYAAACEMQPDFFEAWYRSGEVARIQRQHTLAVQAFQKAFALRPDYLLSLPWLLEQLTLCGDTRAVIQSCELFLDPDLLKSPWYLNLPAESQIFLQKWIPRVEGLQIFSFFCREELDTPTLMGAIRDFAKRHAAPHYAQNLPPRDLNPERRLRVGYLSNELSSDSFYQLYALLFQSQDNATFDFYAYNDSAASTGPVVEVLQGYFQNWRNSHHLTNQELWEQFAQDQLDILVDLSGLINPGRLSLLARKPAPLLVLGGANPPFTSGLEVADYLLSDPILSPPEIAQLYPEKVWMTSCFLHWTLPEIPYESGEAPCLDNGYVTFGCSNSINKLSGSTLLLWCEILKAVPRSRLYLKTPSLDDHLLRADLQSFFFRQGLGPDRIRLQGAEIDHPHLPFFYGQVDIALDPFPYNGGLTSFEALWMGVPVISLAGERRVGESVLSALALNHWSCKSPEDYFKTAVELALQPQEIQRWRSQLRQKVVASVVCDGPAYARELEGAYRQIWRDYCASERATAL